MEVVNPGKTIRLRARYVDASGAWTSFPAPTVTILDPSGATVVSAAVLTKDTRDDATTVNVDEPGWYHYDLTLSATAPSGTYTVQPSAPGAGWSLGDHTDAFAVMTSAAIAGGSGGGGAVAEATYFVSVEASAAAASKNHLVLYNAAASGKTIHVQRVKAAGAPTAAVTGQIIALIAKRWKGAAANTPVGGTVRVPLVASSADPADPSTLIRGVIAPTSLPVGATLDTMPFGVGVVSGEETSSGNESVIYEPPPNGKPLELHEGEGLVVQQGALASAGAVNILVAFTVV